LVESPDFYGWLAGWPKLPIPLVQRAHGSHTYYQYELGQPARRAGMRLETWSYRRADAWVAVSQHTGDLTRKLFTLPSDPNAVVYNPVRIPNAVPDFTQRQAGNVVFTGTLTPKKGIISLLDAWSSVRKQCDCARLHIFGKNLPLGESLSMQEYLLQRLPQEHHSSVQFHGHVAHDVLFKALCSARVAVFPSYTEAFGLGAVEAMACACPTIYTKRTCGPEIVRDGIDGLLVDPDQPSDIAQAILSILKDDARAIHLSTMGRERVQTEFAFEKVIPANETFFSTVMRSFAD
jgi:glycosyltransferase involved in cell wall biosynthesis